jgi:hypothetical protein
MSLDGNTRETRRTHVLRGSKKGIMTMKIVTNESDGVFAQPGEAVPRQAVLAEPVVAPVVQPPQYVQVAGTADNVHVGTDAAEHVLVSSQRQRFSMAGIVSAFAGAAILIIGLVALARGDFDSTVNEPVFEVAGFNHTQLLSMIEIGLGALLLIVGMANSMAGMRVLGGAAVIGSIVALVEPNALGGELQIESGHAWLILLLGAATLIAAAALPTIERQSRRVSTHHQADRNDYVA